VSMTYTPKGVHSYWAQSTALPIPVISSLSDTPRDEDLGAFTMTVTGTGFRHDSVVRWAGSDRTTAYVSSTSLTAEILAGDVDDAGTFAVTVNNPGIGVSNSSTFTVDVAAAWSPADLSPLFWVDADDSATITIATGVSQWADKSGNAYHLVQATGSAQPAVASGALNGLDVVRFNGSSHRLAVSSFPTAESAYSVYIVVDKAADPANASPKVGAWHGTSDGGVSNASHFPFSDGNVYESFGSSARKTVGNLTPSLASARIWNVNSASGAWSTYLDGTSVFSTGTNTVGMSSTFHVGSNGGSTVFLEGDVAEIVMFNSVLSTGDRQALEGYLAWKWGLEANLPGGHPYEGAPP